MGDIEWQPDWDVIKHDLSGRVREIRMELYGEHGGPMLASALEIPYRNWVRYESGASMPAQAMLRFLEVTGTSPHWLLTGDGPKFSPPRGPA
ncbi:hypothetical protein [Paludisphaera mucosa]|uniref:HTH cro/C1-type domain-containing protein n=1 Tax=Paludisphaera mucosa TaxID=3030827 RepID=A0ABT6FGI5_9BACT|nr:hypothetical protein [Paludisphaera mucosa]MDG3006682.1 hypothetical protein [Paludisphaera mucosa]